MYPISSYVLLPNSVASHYDRNEPSHIERLIDAGSTYFQELVTKTAEGRWVLRDVDAYWVLRSPEVMAQETIASWKARFPLVVEDLQAMPKEPMIIAEGPGLFPEERGLTVCEVDGYRSLEEMVTVVEQHFQPLLGT